MSLTTTATITSKLQWVHTDTNLDDTRISNTGGVSVTKSYANGTGIDEVNNQWNTSQTLGSGTVDEYDLTNLTKTLFGGSFTVSFESGSIKAFEIECISTGTGHGVTVTFTGGNGFSNLFGSTGAAPFVGPGDTLLMTASHDGFSVTSTNKNFQINDNGLGSEYSIGVVGVT